MSSSTPITRRQLLYSGLALPLASVAARASTPQASATAGTSVYDRLGVKTYINAYGTLTTLGGSLMLPQVKAAMEEASRHFVEIHDLQAKIGARLAELTGAEAAFVTAGSSAALCLATCAVTAGGDPEKIDRLPNLEGMKNEIVIQKVHLNSYDHAFRMVGTTLIVAETEAEVRAAIGPKTAALAMVLSHNSLGHKVPLEGMIAIAHEHGLPLILDAAAELPPVDNLTKFVGMGADLVAFSGGKNLRGPQCSGMLLGRRDLIEAAYANSSPHNRFARIAKVGKEEMVGLLTAVEVYMNERDHAAERAEHHAMLERVSQRLEGLPTVVTEYATNDDYSHSPRLTVQWDEQALGITLDQVMRELKEGEPGIVATDMTRYRPAWKGVGIFPYNLQPGEELIVADRLREILGRSD